MNILLAISGGIAAYKAPKIVSLLVEEGHTVRVIATVHALRFVSPLTLAALSGSPVESDLFEGEGDFDMKHIRLPEWADIIVVAPASANLLAKVASGLADDMVSTSLIATGTGEGAACPIVYCPAMNQRMWNHPATQSNLQQLEDWGAKSISPQRGRLACSDRGEGRMPEPEEIVAVLKEWGLLGGSPGDTPPD